MEFITGNFDNILNVIIIIGCLFCPSPTKLLTALKSAKDVKKEVDEFRGQNGQKRD